MQLLAHQQAAIAFHLPALLAGDLHLRRNAEQGLNMVSDFVSDHVGLGEIARGRKALGHLLEEAHVQIDLLVCGAIEGAGRRGCQPAGRIDPVAEQHQGRVLVLPVRLLENLPPGVLGVAEDRAHELGPFVIGRWRLARL
ncbi:hypothetical protein D3C81_1711670 [compost metagenome]